MFCVSFVDIYQRSLLSFIDEDLMDFELLVGMFWGLVESNIEQGMLKVEGEEKKEGKICGFTFLY